MLENGVYAKDMKVGIIYSAGGGEFQVDKDGKVWYKSYYDGTIREVNPHPHSLMYVVREVGEG